MPAHDRDARANGAPPPEDALTSRLARARRAVLRGCGLDAALPSGTAPLLGLDALTLGAVTRSRPLELLWCDPSDGLGRDLDNLQYTLGDGPAWESAHRGRLMTEPDLTEADPSRWPAFLPAAAHTSARSVVAAPLQLGAATVGVLTGYRTTPGPLSTAQLHDFQRLARALLALLLHATLATPAHENGPGAGLRLYRAEVHQATGFVAQALDIPLSQALLRLRAHAAAHDQDLSALARAIIARRLPPETIDL